MEETDPERILPTKRNLAEAPGVVTPGPMLSPMGMPMSPQLPGRPVVPGEQSRYDEPVFTPAEPAVPVEPFGQLEPMVPGAFAAPVEPHVYPLEPVQSTQYFMPAESRPLEPMIPAEPATPLQPVRYDSPAEPLMYGEPRTLPALEPKTGLLPAGDHCCACCGNVHDVPQGQLLPRGELIPAGDPLPGEAVSGWQPGRLEPMIPGQPAELQSGMRVPGRIIEPGERTPRGEHAPGENRQGEVTKPDDECGDRLPRGEHARGENTEGVVTEPGERVPRGQHAPGENTEGVVTEPGERLLPRGKQAPGESTEGEVTEPEVPCACCGKVHPGAVRAGEPMERLSPYQPGLERPREAVQGEPLLPGRVTPGEALTPAIPATQGTPVTPGMPLTPLTPATATIPAIPATPANVGALPQQEEPKQFFRSEKPVEALTPGQTVPGQPLVPQQPVTPLEPGSPPIYTPAQFQPVTQPTNPVMPVTTTPGGGGGGGNPYTFSNVPGQTGNVPKDGNVGPDPNVKFDEASYNQLIGEVDTVRTTLRTANRRDGVYLDADLLLQPTGQEWLPAQNLVKWGTAFGTSVATTAKDLGKTLKTFHTALEKGKAVFKETDDLAAYDATRFTTEYPGFGGGLPGA